MPYVAPDPNRKHLDPYIDNLVQSILRIGALSEDVQLVGDNVLVLAHKSKTYKPGENYWYEFQGDLNYCSTETLIRILLAKPKFKYWMETRMHGLCLGVASTFERLANGRGILATNRFDGMLFSPRSEMFENWYSELPVDEPEKLWGEVLRYVFINLAWNIMPDYKHWTLESVAGVFMDIPAEFYRRITAGYEDMKIDENGDVSYRKLADKVLGAWLNKQWNSLPHP